MKKLYFSTSLFFFTIPAVLLFFSFNLLMPKLINQGMLPFLAYFLCLGLPLFFLLIASLVGFRLENHTLTLKGIKDRFRLKALSRNDWLTILLVFLITFILTGAFLALEQFILTSGLIKVPTYVPEFLNPISGKNPVDSFTIAFGGYLQGNYFALFLLLLFLVCNIIGEEFWWRGYILPRQELAYGNKAWIIHGILIYLFHFFKWWDVLMLIPVAFALPFLASRLKNTTASIVFHTFFNLVGFYPIILGVLK